MNPVQGSVGDLAHASIDVFAGPSANGKVVGGGFTMGAGMGAGGLTGASNTVLFGPVSHLW